MWRAGRNNPSRLLILMFAAWVLAPFVALSLANAYSKRWRMGVQLCLQIASLLLTLGAVAAYGSAGSENSDHIHSGNSGHPGVRALGSRLAVESGEGKDAGHAEASRDSGFTASGAQPAGGGKAGRGFRPKRPTGGGRRGGQQHR